MEHKAVDLNKDGLYELGNEEVPSNDYTVYPGVNIPKDPFVRIEGLTKDAYLFIEIVGDNNKDFSWSVRDSWQETNLVGLKNGTVYVYKGTNDDIAPLNETTGEFFEEYIFNGIAESENGGIVVSDNYKNNNKVNVQFRGYLVQDENFDDYVDAYNTLVAR